MDCGLSTFDFLRGEFPKVDIRLIKATVLEHGDDVECALHYLKGIDNEGMDTSMVQVAGDSYLSRTYSTTIDCNALAIESETAVHDDYATPELSSSNAFLSLEDIVEEAKNDKELVINLVKEVSHLRAKADQESMAALRAKSEAATSGESLLKKADEVCKEISQKKQENLLRMGEIYGEKAVLATEERELRRRLEQVKLQKERAITTLHEIQVRLQGFYDAAVEEKNMAEEDGRVKEERAQKVLADEEAIMAEVEEESKKLDMEAEACIMVKESLAQYGSIVDSLQGEMSILIEDVESFKRQVEEGMWSSVSTVSMSSNLNPEGPYTFRKCNLPSTGSGQDLGQSFEALYSSRLSHRMSASLSQDSGLSWPSNVTPEDPYTFRCELPNTASSQGLEQSFEALYSSVRSHNRLSASSSQEMSNSFCGQSNASSQDFKHHASNVEENVGRHYQLVNDGSLTCGNREDVTSNIMFSAGNDGAYLHGMEMVKACSTPYGSNHLLGKGSANGIAESGEQFTNPLDNTYHTSARVESGRVGDDWVITSKQLEDSCSSSSSSMVKVEADDYRSN